MRNQQWTWAAASCRGTSHVRSSTRLQDAFKCIANFAGDNIIIAVISDGAGSAIRGGEGASLVCRTLLQCGKEHFSSVADLPDDDTIWSWIAKIRDRISLAAANRSLEIKDFAATLVCAISSGTETLVLHIGDGCVVAQCSDSTDWIALTWPEQGEYASTTFFVTDCPQPRLNITRHFMGVSSLVLFSDGLERLALDLKAKVPHQPFFRAITKAVFSSVVTGKDKLLSNALADFLNSNAVNTRTDDDKTLILAVCR